VSDTDGPLRVATWNILHGRPWPGHRPFLPERYGDAVADLDVDVLGLQEVDRHVFRSWFADQAKLAARALNAPTHVFAGAQWLGPGGRMGNALVVRGTIEHTTVVWQPTSPGHERRNAIVASVVARGRRFSIGVTHLQNFRGEARDGLTATIDALAARPLPRVLMGDLNLPTDECRGPLEAAGYTLLDTYHPHGAVATHDHAPRIDHIAIMGVTGVEVEVPKPPISDHEPIVAELAPEAERSSGPTGPAVSRPERWSNDRKVARRARAG
jgi:endonuclease/exonuclease/phosphatase family metal-dependent hydrolase